MFLLFSECRTLPFRFGIASHKTCCSPFYCSAWSHDFVVTDAATRHRRVSVTDTSTQTSYCHHRDLVATSFSDFLPLFCWDSTLHPPELFPFLDDAKLICSLRPTRTPCFTSVWIADEPDPCQAASFSIFRSAQVLDAGGSFWRALPYLNTALFSSWHISWPKCICFLSDYWSPSSRMWVPWEPKPSAFLTGMSPPEPRMQWMAIKYLQNSWMIWKTVKYIQFSKMMTGTNYAGPSRVQESSLCMPISAAIFI